MALANFQRQSLALLAALCLVACSNGSTNSIDYSCHELAGAPLTPTAKNQAPVITGCGYFNEPCVTVTICVPGTGTCQTIPNVLLDTGSVGLRLFSCAVTIPLVTEIDSFGNAVADYESFLDGSCMWGPVKTADIYIGSADVASGVPIQIIDSTFVTLPSTAYLPPNGQCTTPAYSGLASGYNGILGVGLSTSDCYLGDPSQCAGNGTNFTYFSCTNSSCLPNSAPANMQVTNPITHIATDNNGVVLSMNPMTNPNGATTLTGTLTLGVGTQTGINGFAANGLTYTPSGGGGPYTATVYHTDIYDDFQTNNFAGFDGFPYQVGSVFGFIDSGSNSYLFPVGTTDTSFIQSLPVCADSEFYCPSGLSNPIPANQADESGVPSSPQISFQIGNADILLSATNPNLVFNDVAVNEPISVNSAYIFDWGFPFFIGNTVYVHIKGQSGPSADTRAYWAW